MTGTLRVRRSRGALSGVLLVLLGIWGALIPFVGPYFHLAYTPDRAWDYTAGRLWLEILPGLATLVGGTLVLISRLRPVAVFGTWLAAAGGAWFAVGGLVGRHWTSIPSAGTPVGGTGRMALEQFSFFIGLGVVIVFLAGAAMGRLSVVTARDIALSKSVPSEPDSPEPVASKPASRSGLAGLSSRLRLPAPVVRAKDPSVAGSSSQDDTESARAGTSA